MVAYNPVLRGKWTIKKFNATVINDIWPEVLFFSAVATMVTFVSIKTPHSLAISPQLLTVLGTVLGLVISFRTSTAYERYQDGRKMWANISIVSRNLAQMIWIHVPNERLNKEQNKVQTTLESVIEKKTMINLVQAFSVAIKHFLRGENGVYYQDLYPLICFLPRFASNTATGTSEMLPLWQASEDGEHPYDHNVHSTIPEPSDDDTPESKDRPSLSPAPSSSWLQSIGKRSTKSKTKAFDPEKALASVHSHRPLKPARNPPKVTLYDYIPILLFFKWIGKMFSRRIDSVRGATRNALGRKIKPQLQESNVPLEITIFLSSYSAFLMRNGLIQPAIAASITANIGMLQDTMNNLGRIATTPLPFAYQAHLRMSLWIYLFLLPFQVFDSFKYLTIPATAFASFLLLGFLEIGSEIENPFNYDLNDLDLDSFCLAIQRELQEITAHPLPDPASFIFTPWNQPFAPGDRRTAAELVKGQSEYGHAENDENGMASIKQTLLRSWRHTDDLTREAR